MKLKNFLRTVAAGVALAVTGHAQTVFNATNNLGSPVAVAYYATNSLGAISSFGSLTNVATNSVAVLSNTNVWTGVAIVSSGIGAARVNPFSTLANTNGAPVNYLATNGLLQYFNLLTLSTPGGAVTNGATPTNSPSGAIPLPVQNYAGTNFPNGIYSAGYGSLYNQFDTPTGTNFISQWIKTTTTGNMGWVVNTNFLGSGGSASYASQVKSVSGNYNAAVDAALMPGTNFLYSVNTSASNILFTLPAAFANQFGVENHGTNIVVFTNATGVTCVIPNGTNLSYVTTFSNLYPLKVVWFEQLNTTNILVVHERLTDAQIKIVADNEITANPLGFQTSANWDDLNYLQASGYLNQSVGYDVSTTPGVPITMANITGSGVVKKIYMVLGGGAGTGGWQGHLQIYADGEAVPDVDAELGTLFLTGQGVFSAASFTASTKHIKMGCNSGQGIIGASFFDVPFTNGCKVVYYAPSYVNSGDTLFWQIAYQTNSNPFPNLRLKSVCLPLTSAVDYPSNAIINLFDETNTAGWLVWKGVNTFATNGIIDYLERIWYYGADNEVLTTNGGVVSGRYSTSGGEDESDLGWFFLGGLRVAGDPHSMVTLDSSGKANFGYEFLDQGGIHFTNNLLCGWSLKPVVFQGDVTVAYTYLFYDNIAVPYPPAQASLSGSFTSNSIVLNIGNPISQGSSPITGWFITLTNTVANTNTTFYTGATNSSLTIAGVVGTNGANYSFNITASNNIGAGWRSTNFTFAAYVPPPTPTNILANRMYYFNGNLNDSSGNGYTLSGNPSPNYQTGQNGLANNAIDAYYTDTNDAVGVAATYPLTLTAWVKLPVSFGSGYIFGEFNNASPSSNAHYLYVSSSGTCQASTAAGGFLTASSAVNVAAGWHFLAGVFSNPTNRVIYVDGVSSGTNTTSGTPSGLNCVGNPGVSPGIGGPSASTGNILDDCRVFTNALTSAQISDLYNYGAQ